RAGALQRELGCPVAIGFGVKTKDDVATVAPHVDGVVVGSAVVRTIEDAASPEQAVASVRELVAGLTKGLIRQ
ncbi:MAG: tryptophan synthase subunit alpha, partial [Deltaproteobacteria bacterium]|nr:tryptophan synthase subunit alpha [Deltaproteobacteria bacterium]